MKIQRKERDGLSLAMIRVNNISKYYFLQIKKSVELDNIETLEMICSFFTKNQYKVAHIDNIENELKRKDKELERLYHQLTLLEEKFEKNTIE